MGQARCFKGRSWISGKYYQQPNRWRTFSSGIAVGLAVGPKYSGLLRRRWSGLRFAHESAEVLDTIAESSVEQQRKSAQ